MRTVIISDTHNLHNYIKDIPDGDVLIHAGDSTMGGSPDELSKFVAWIGQQPHRNKLIIAGNHDFGFNNNHREDIEKFVQENGVSYLRDSGIEINGIRFWGSPWTPFFHDWAFNLARGEEIARKWNLIPDDINVLITHGPPHGILDMTKRGIPAGCEMLIERIAQLKQLKYHIFGHIHEGYGMVEKMGVRFVNASTCTARYAPTNKPIVIEM